MTDIAIKRRSSPRHREVTNERIAPRDDKTVRGPRHCPPAPAQSHSLALFLAYVWLWLSCWYPECPIITSKHS